MIIKIHRHDYSPNNIVKSVQSITSYEQFT